MLKAPPDKGKLRISVLMMGRKKPPSPPTDDVSNLPDSMDTDNQGLPDDVTKQNVDESENGPSDADKDQADEMLKEVSSRLQELSARMPELRGLQKQIDAACGLLGYGSAGGGSNGTRADKGQWKNDDYLDSLSPS